MPEEKSMIQQVMENVRSNIDTIRTSIASTRTSLIGTRSEVLGGVLERIGKPKAGGILGLGILPVFKKKPEEEEKTTETGPTFPGVAAKEAPTVKTTVPSVGVPTMIGGFEID